MNLLFRWALETLVTTTLLALLVVVLRRWFHQQPAIQHLLWLVVLARFLMPPLIPWPGFVQGGSRALIETVTPTQSLDQAPSGRLVEINTVATTEFVNANADGRTKSDGIPITLILLSAWIAGAILIAARQCLKIRQCRILLQSTMTPPRHLLEEIQSLSNGLGMNSIPVQIADRITSPFLWCFGCLRLVWPRALCGVDEVRNSRTILAHELAHVRRYDHWTAWLELTASLVWWWNPIFWLVRHRLRESAEMACDAMALGAFPEERLTYAKLFLQLSSDSKPGAPAPALGVSAGAPSSFERRLTMILSEGVSGKLSPAGICAGLALLGLGVPSLLCGAQKEADISHGTPGKVIYLVDDDGDGVADRPAGKVEASDDKGDSTTGRFFYLIDDDEKGKEKSRQKVAVLNSRLIENGIQMVTLGKADAIARNQARQQQVADRQQTSKDADAPEGSRNSPDQPPLAPLKAEFLDDQGRLSSLFQGLGLLQEQQKEIEAHRARFEALRDQMEKEGRQMIEQQMQQFERDTKDLQRKARQLESAVGRKDVVHGDAKSRNKSGRSQKASGDETEITQEGVVNGHGATGSFSSGQATISGGSRAGGSAGGFATGTSKGSATGSAGGSSTGRATGNSFGGASGSGISNSSGSTSGGVTGSATSGGTFFQSQTSQSGTGSGFASGITQGLNNLGAQTDSGSGDSKQTSQSLQQNSFSKSVKSMTQVVPSNNSTLKVTIQSQSGDQEKNTEMTAHDGNSNRLLWTTKLGSRADVTSFTVQGDVISVSTDHGETLTFDARTGRQLQDNSEKPQDQSNDQPVDSRPKRETKKRPPKGDKK